MDLKGIKEEKIEVYLGIVECMIVYFYYIFVSFI